MRTSAVILFVVLAACASGDDAPPPPGRSERDSVNLTVVEPDSSGAVHKTVAETPDVVIGDSDPEALDDVRSTLLAGSGELVNADGGSREIRVFDSSGRFLTSFGRAGGGPGEFEDLHTLGRARAEPANRAPQSMPLPDSVLMAYTSRHSQRRVGVLVSASGRMAYTTRISIERDPPLGGLCAQPRVPARRAPRITRVRPALSTSNRATRHAPVLKSKLKSKSNCPCSVPPILSFSPAPSAS